MALYERINTIELANDNTTVFQNAWSFAQSNPLNVSRGEISGDNLYGMNFKVGEIGTNEANILYSIKTKLLKYGAPGTVYCEIYAVDVAHKPTGLVLAAASHPQEDILTTEATEVEFILTPSYTLQANTEYSFILSAPDGGGYRNSYSVYCSSLEE